MMTKYQHGSGNEMTSPLRLCSSTQEAAIALEKSPLKTCWGLPKGSTFSSLYCLGCFQYSAYFKVKNQPTPAGQVMINKQRRENRKSGFKWQRGTCQSSSWVTGGQNSEGGGGKMERERERAGETAGPHHTYTTPLWVCLSLSDQTRTLNKGILAIFSLYRAIWTSKTVNITAHNMWAFFISLLFYLLILIVPDAKTSSLLLVRE